MVEACFVLPVFAMMVFGILEFGSAYGDYLSTSNMAQLAARQESIQGNYLQADWLTLQAVKNGPNALPMSRVKMIVVFKASGPGMAVPTNCKTASQNVGGLTTPGVGSCNRFTAAEWNAVNGNTWDCNSTQIKNYCPSYRKVTIAGPPDYLGIYVESEHPYITGLFGKSVTLTDTTIIRLEPQKLS